MGREVGWIGWIEWLDCSAWAAAGELVADDRGVDDEEGLLMFGEVTEVLLALLLSRASSEKSVLMVTEVDCRRSFDDSGMDERNAHFYSCRLVEDELLNRCQLVKGYDL